MNYTYEELKADLAMGHEVEFNYKQHKYSISNNDKGWYLTKYHDENYQIFNSAQELLEYARVDFKKLNEIWSEVEVETIF